MTTLSQDGEARLTRPDGGADPSAANPAAFGKVSRGREVLPFHQSVIRAAGLSNSHAEK
jgi:hypothetical protein